MDGVHEWHLLSEEASAVAYWEVFLAVDTAGFFNSNIPVR